jgi:hypothetical protein
VEAAHAYAAAANADCRNFGTSIRYACGWVGGVDLREDSQHWNSEYIIEEAHDGPHHITGTALVA